MKRTIERETDFGFPFSNHLLSLRYNFIMSLLLWQFKSFKVGSSETSHVTSVSTILSVPVKEDLTEKHLKIKIGQFPSGLYEIDILTLSSNI